MSAAYCYVFLTKSYRCNSDHTGRHLASFTTHMFLIKSFRCKNDNTLSRVALECWRVPGLLHNTHVSGQILSLREQRKLVLAGTWRSSQHTCPTRRRRQWPRGKRSSSTRRLRTCLRTKPRRAPSTSCRTPSLCSCCACAPAVCSLRAACLVKEEPAVRWHACVAFTRQAVQVFTLPESLAGSLQYRELGSQHSHAHGTASCTVAPFGKQRLNNVLAFDHELLQK